MRIRCDPRSSRVMSTVLLRVCRALQLNSQRKENGSLSGSEELEASNCTCRGTASQFRGSQRRFGSSGLPRRQTMRENFTFRIARALSLNRSCASRSTTNCIGSTQRATTVSFLVICVDQRLAGNKCSTASDFCTNEQTSTRNNDLRKAGDRNHSPGSWRKVPRNTRIISDNGPQFIAKHFEHFLSLYSDCYVTSLAMLEGRQLEIFDERDRKLEQARELRARTRVAKSFGKSTDSLSNQELEVYPVSVVAEDRALSGGNRAPLHCRWRNALVASDCASSFKNHSVNGAVRQILGLGDGPKHRPNQPPMCSAYASFLCYSLPLFPRLTLNQYILRLIETC